MILPDVNVLVYAFREDSPRHVEVRGWLDGVLASGEAFAVNHLVLAGFLRVVTHPKVFDPPTPRAEALQFVEALLAQPACVVIGPGTRHWSIFTRLLDAADARGNLVSDAWHAAVAIESGCEWITTDRDFARFEGLRWRPPTP